jgi:CHAT domain-containing protein
VQGFSELPSVADEIRSISSMFAAPSMQDETFMLNSVSTQLSAPAYSVAHLATHGEFSADHRKSFILTYDNRLTMDALRTSLERRGNSLDLLVLSACKTAAGDDRAALGLAGIAVQAGAKSALASLWSISDKATAELMTSFYQNSKSSGASKAQSLRQAQLALLKSPEYRHPSYWAPYLLIGNWL